MSNHISPASLAGRKPCTLTARPPRQRSAQSQETKPSDKVSKPPVDFGSWMSAHSKKVG